MSWDAIAPTEEPEKPWEYSDLPKAAISGGAQTVSGLAGLARNYIADTEKGREVLRQIQRGAGNVEESAEESMTPQGRKLLGANLTSEEFLSHPVASVVLKTMSMTPSMAASALPGGVIASAAGRIAGLAATAATSGALGAADIENTIESEINKGNDKDLQEQSSLYRGYRADMSERDAKEELTKQMLGWKPAIGFLLGVGTGMYGPAGNIVRGLEKEGVRHGIKHAATEGFLSETAEETYGAYAGQKAEVERGARESVDLSEVIAQGLTGGLMGGLLGGASGIGAGKHGKVKADVETETTGRGAEEPAVQAPAEGAPAAEPIGTGAEAVKNVKRKAKDAAKGVENVEPLAPNAAEAASIKDLAQPEKPTVQQAAELAQPDVPPPAAQPPQPPAPDVAQPQQAAPTPPAEPVAAPPAELGASAPTQPELGASAPPAGAPTDVSARARTVTPEVTPEPPAPSQPAAPVAQEAAPVPEAPPAPTAPTEAPTEPVTPTGRVLTQTTPEVAAAQKKQTRRGKAAAEKADIEARRAAGEDVAAPSKKGKTADAAKAARAAHAERIFGEDHKPLEMPETKEARAALADTLQLTLDKAASHGLVLRETLPEDVRKRQVGEAYHLSIPQQVGDKRMAPHVRYLRELHDIVQTLRSGEGWRNKKDGSEGDSVGRVRDFITNHNIKDMEGIAERRKYWGDKLMRRHQGDAAELAEGAAPRKGKVKTAVSEGAASTREFTPEEKAKLAAEIEAKVNAPKKPITTPAEVKAKAAEAKAAEAPPITTPAEVKAKAAEATAAPKVSYATPPAGMSEKARHAALRKIGLTPDQINALSTKAQIDFLKNPPPEPAAPTIPADVMQDLSTMGYSHADIKGMTLEQATHIVDEGIVKPKAEVPEEIGHADETEQERINREKVEEIEKQEREKLAFLNQKKERPTGTQAASAEEVAAHAPKAVKAPVVVAKRRLSLEKSLSKKVGEATEKFAEPDKIINVNDTREATPIRTTNAREALRGVNLTHLQGIQYHIAKHMKDTLTDLVGDTPIHVITDKDMDHLDGPRTKGFMRRVTDHNGKEIGRYIVLRQSVIDGDPAGATHLLLHEVTHDLINRAVDFDPSINNAVGRMAQEVIAYLDANPSIADELSSKYALTSKKEFLAEAFSNPEFQDLLSRVPVSPELARALKLDEGKTSAWDAILKTVRGVLEKALGRQLPGSPKMIEAILRIGDYAHEDRVTRMAFGHIGQKSLGQIHETVMAHHKALGRIKEDTSKLSTDEVLDRASRGVKDAKINLKGGLARAKDALSSTWNMVGRGLKYFGPSNPLNRLFNARAAMEHEKGKILSEAHADKVISDLAATERNHPELAQELKDKVVFEAALHDVNLEGNNDHLGKDKLMGHQAKGEVARLQALWNSKKFDPIRQAYSNAFKFYRDLHNQVSYATIKNILAEANIHDKAIIDRIHNEGVSEQDEAWMDSHLLKELSQIRELKRKQGSFVPFRRYGEFISAANHELVVPRNGTKVNDNTIQFIDPTGKGGNARARAQVKMYLRQASHTPQGNKLVPAQIRKVWVDQNDPSKIVEAEDQNAIPAYQVSMQTDHVEMHETEAQAENSRAALEEAGLSNPRTHKRDKAFENTRGNLQSAMGAVLRSLEKQQRYINADSTQKAAMREMFHDLTLGMSGTTSIKNSMRQRRNVAGMSHDLPKVTADYGRMVANHLAMLRHRPEIDSTFAEMRQYMKDHSDKDNIRRKEVYDEFVKRIYGTESEEHKPGVVTRLLQMTRLSRLAGPSFHIINAHEPWTTSLPIIGGRHGFIKTMRTLTDTYNLIGGRSGLIRGFQDMAKAYTNDNGFTDYPKLFKEAIGKSKILGGNKAERLQDMIDYMNKRNLYGNSAIFEVGRYADPSGNIAGRALDRADLMANQVGSAIEAINRTVTGLTAYDLEYKRNGGNHEAAMHYAYSTAHDTMGDYSNWNAAPVFNTPVGRIALQFKKFGHKTYNLLGNVMGGAIRGDPEAMKQFAGLMVTHAMVAGALGLPTEPFKVALMAANALGVTGFTPDDYEYAVRQLAARVAGQKGGEIISKGLYRGIGIDVSSRFGLDTLLTHGAPKSDKPADISAWLFDTMAGAPAGYLLDQVKAAQALMKGDVPGFIEKASPIRSIADITKAGIGLAGPKKSAAGTTTQEQFSPYQAGVRALGFTPSAVAEMGALRGTVAREGKRLSGNRSEVIQTWVDASGGDKVSAQRLVQKWNAAHPLKTEQISQSDLTSAARRQVRDTKAEKHGVRIDKRTKPIYERAAGTFNP